MSALFRRPETRSISYQQWWGAGQDNPRGDVLNVALSVVPVYAAVGLIADAVAASPWAGFQKTGGVPEKLATQRQLITHPGVNIDLFTWKHQLVTSLKLWGNSYGFIVAIDSAGVPAQVVWLRPDRMVVNEEGPHPIYLYNGKEIDRSLIMHVRDVVVPGTVVGLSPIKLFRAQIETGVEAQKVGRSFFRRGAVPAAMLKNTAKQLTAEQANETKRRFAASVSSSEPFVSGSDWEYQAIGLPASDVSFLTAIKATATQIAAVYRVAPEDVGGETSSSSLTYKSLEQDQIRFNTRTLRPVAGRIESVVDPYLPKTEYVRFNLDASVRADLKTRFDAHAVAIKSGFETRDEARAFEERPPLTDDQLAQFREFYQIDSGKTGAA